MGPDSDCRFDAVTVKQTGPLARKAMNQEALSCKNLGVRVNSKYEGDFDDFEIRHATSQADLNKCFRLRHQVYCVENTYEPCDSSLQQLETDKYDKYSAHALVIHKSTGLVAGTVRLILPESDLRPPLPMLALTGNKPIPFPLTFTAEISRFAISKEFRKRLLQTRGQPGHMRNSVNRDMVILCLIRAFIELGAKYGVHHFCALKEGSLIRRVARLGIHFEPIGPEVECRGKRIPCMVGGAEMLGRVRLERPDGWRSISDGGRLSDEFCLPLAAE